MNKKLIKNFVLDTLYSFNASESVYIIVYRYVEILLLPYILKVIGDKYANNSLNVQNVTLLILLYALIFCLRYILDVCFWKQLLYKTYVKLDNKIKLNLFNFIIKHSMNYFNNTQSGIVTSKFNNVVNSLNGIFGNIFMIIGGLGILVISLFVYLKINIVLFVFLCIWSVIFVLYNYYSSKIIFKYEKNVFNENNKISGIMTDNFANILNIKSMSKQHIEKGNVKKQGINILKADSQNLICKFFSNFIMFILMMILMCFMLIYSVKLYMLHQITIGTMIFIGQNIILLSMLLNRIYKSTITFIKQYSELSDGLETLIQPYSIVDKPYAKILNINSGKIIFKSVYFKY